MSRGPGVHVSTFGGEGTGLKAMVDFPWLEGEEVTFTVTGEREGEGQGEWWKVSCSYTHRGKTLALATYRRQGGRPLSQVSRLS